MMSTMNYASLIPAKFNHSANFCNALNVPAFTYNYVEGDDPFKYLYPRYCYVCGGSGESKLVPAGGSRDYMMTDYLSCGSCSGGGIDKIPLTEFYGKNTWSEIFECFNTNVVSDPVYTHAQNVKLNNEYNAP